MLMGFGATSAMADTILFPYINSNPGNVSTIISVINTLDTTDVACNGNNQEFLLHYWYFTKPSSGTGSAAVDPCIEHDFRRPISKGDIVSFDCAGTLGAGEALWESDTAFYTYGTSNNFDVPSTGGFADARRGYLMVNHNCTGGGGAGDIVIGRGGLDGEAFLVDVNGGAGYSYRAVVANQELLAASGGFPLAPPLAPGMPPTVVGGLRYAFTPTLNAAVDVPGITPSAGMTTDLVAESPVMEAANYPFPNVSYLHNEYFALYPPTVMQTRFFVTPLYVNIAPQITPVNIDQRVDMSAQPNALQKRTRISLVDAEGVQGVTGRMEDPKSRSNEANIRCVGAVNLEELYSGDVDWPSTGGWAALDLQNPSALTGEMLIMVITMQ